MDYANKCKVMDMSDVESRTPHSPLLTLDILMTLTGT